MTDQTKPHRFEPAREPSRRAFPGFSVPGISSVTRQQDICPHESITRGQQKRQRSRNMKASLWSAVVICTATLLSAQTNPTPAAKPKKAVQKSAAASSDEVNALRNALAAQQRQVEQQREQM